MPVTGVQTCALPIFPAGTGHKRVVMNADGSNQRTVFSGGFSTNWNAEQNWSPDGKYIAFRDETMTGSTLNVVDVATGTSRVVAKPELAVMQFRWRSDSRAIVYGHRSGNWEHGRTTVREVTLDGAERVLLDLADRPLSNGGVMFVGDSGVLVPGGGFFGTFHSTELKAMIDTVPTARRGGQQWAPAASRDGRWIAHQAVSDPSNQTIEVLSVDGKTRFAVKQPFPHGWGTTRQFDGDGRNIVAASGPTPGSPAAIYAIPVAGGAPRVIVTLAPGTHVSEFSVSPDGKTVLYSTSGALTTTLLDVDLGVGLPARLPKQ